MKTWGNKDSLKPAGRRAHDDDVVSTLLTHYTTMLLGKEPHPGEAANLGLIQRSLSEAPGRGVCMRTGAGNVRVTDYRKEVLTRARRVSHVFQDSSILHMNEGLWHGGSCRMRL